MTPVLNTGPAMRTRADYFCVIAIESFERGSPKG